MANQTFDLKHLILLVTATAMLLAVFRVVPELVFVLCPFLIGPIVAHSISPTPSSVTAGLFSALFWSFLIGYFVYMFLSISWGPPRDTAVMPLPEKQIGISVFFIAVLTNIVVGYLGARISTN